ncbi:MAG: hypothetical protein ACREH4_05920, partial [Vitreimonas sp.]
VGANWYSTIGDGMVSAPVRNGNYLVHHTVLDGFNGWELNAGWDFGTWALGAGYGELTRDVTTYQSCPEDWNAVVAGFCRGGGVPATAESREGLRGGEPSEDTTESWRFFGRYDVTEHLAITASYQAAEFDQSIAPLDVIGAQPADRVAHPPTSFAQDFEIFAIGAEIRF